MSDGIAYKVVDVFTKRRFAGNPLAIVFLNHESHFNSRRMLQIAKEFNLEETAFVYPPSKYCNDDSIISEKLRIFTPDSEVPFARHSSVGVATVIARGMDQGVDCMPSKDSVVKKIVLIENAGIVHCDVNAGSHLDGNVLGFASIEPPQEF